MKKVFLIVVSLFILIVFVACGQNSKADNDGVHSSEASSNGTDLTESTSNNTDNVVPKTEEYEIKWFDEDGNLLLSEKVEKGKIPSYNYEKSDSVEWDYVFEGWSLESGGDVLSAVPIASEDVSYHAIVSKIKQKYTVKFNTMGGSILPSQTVYYGEKAILPNPPKYEGHKFVGWSYDEQGENSVDFNSPITKDTEYFAVWNEVVDVKTLLSTLLSSYRLNPYCYLPQSMRFECNDKLVDKDSIVNCYSNFVDVSVIPYGYGEQYNMVLENLQESSTIFNLLNTIELISASSITIFNNYFDENPSDTSYYTFENGIYNVTVDFNGEKLYFVVEYIDQVPVLGEQTIQIALCMHIATGEKIVRVQLGETNALSYTVTENSYTFAIEYFNLRTAMLSFEKEVNGDVRGYIYEYLTVAGKNITSCADIYITEDYVSVVGNKASGMIGFAGYINELYNTKTGELLGYEVQETLSAITYNTLWFNLNDIVGIDSIKYIFDEDKEEAKIYVNGSATAWTAKKNLLTRRFDIEFRTQFVYSYDAETDKYTKHAVEVPMIFIQEENYETFVKDVKATNNIDIAINVLDKDLKKILADYDELIPVFIENKDKITIEKIQEFIGSKIEF